MARWPTTERAVGARRKACTGAQRVGLLLASLLAVCGTARAQPSYAGTYRSSARDVKVEVTTWGEDCGTRPQSHTDPKQQQVVVKTQGAHLTLAFPDRAIKTDACWSENPTLRVANATAAGDRWRTECRTPTQEAKRESGVYTITASSANSLELVEESNYNWQLNESRCVAKVRITQRLTREGAPVEAEKPATTGCTPGPIARLKLRPVEARITPGERVCFTVRGTDAAGCVANPSDSELSWSLEKPGSAKATLSSACFKAAASAAEGEGRFQVVVSSGGQRASAVVIVAPLDLSDITARRGSSGEVDTEEEEHAADGTVSGIEAAVKASPLGVKIALGALLLAVVAAVTVVVLRRARPDLGQRDSSILTPMPRAPTQKKAREVPSGPQLICPTCRQGYPPGTERCPKDGTTPIPYEEFVRKAQASEVRHCHACGAKLVPGAQFCGSCGTQVRS